MLQFDDDQRIMLQNEHVDIGSGKPNIKSNNNGLITGEVQSLQIRHHPRLRVRFVSRLGPLAPPE
jgi:hypothetical protein